MRQRLHNERGFSLVFVLGTVVLLTVLVITLLSITATGMKQTTFRGTSLQAVKQAEVGMDRLIEEIESKAKTIIQEKEERAKASKAALTEETILRALKDGLKAFEGKTNSPVRDTTTERQKEKAYTAWFDWDQAKPTRLLLTSIGTVDQTEREITLSMELTPKGIDVEPTDPPVVDPEPEPEGPLVVGQPIIYGYGAKGAAVIGGETNFNNRGAVVPKALETNPDAKLAHIVADDALRTWPYSTTYNAGTNPGVWERVIPDVTLANNAVPSLAADLKVFETSTGKETWSPLNQKPRALTGSTAAKDKERLVQSFGGFVQPSDDYVSFADLPAFSKWYPNGKPLTNDAHRYSFIKDRNYPETIVVPSKANTYKNIKGIANFTTKGTYTFDEIVVDGSAVIGRSTATFANSSNAFEDIRMKGILRVKGDVYIQGADLKNTNVTIIADGNIYFHHNLLPTSSSNVKLKLFSRKHIVMHNIGTSTTTARAMATVFAMADQSIHVSTRRTPVILRTSLVAPYVDVSGNKEAPLTLWSLDDAAMNDPYVIPFQDIWTSVHGERAKMSGRVASRPPAPVSAPTLSTSYELKVGERQME